MNWTEEAYYLRMPPGPPMQGDIWSNLPLPYSTPSVCTGILITPSCDLVHNKTPFLNYLPLLTLEDFMELYGNFELLDQELQDSKQALKRAADPLGIKEALELELPTTPLLDSISTNLQAKASELGVSPGRLEKHLSTFKDVEHRTEKIVALLEKPRLSNGEITSLCSSRAVTKYKLGVARNTTNDLHFLPPCLFLLESPSVVMLRQVVTCSIDLLRCAQDSLSQKDWEMLRQQRSTPDFISGQAKPERLLRLKSPYLELLMFRFGSFFGRVGVRDLERRYLESLIGSSENL